MRSDFLLVLIGKKSLTRKLRQQHTNGTNTKTTLMNVVTLDG